MIKLLLLLLLLLLLSLCLCAFGCSNDDEKAAKQKECDDKAAAIAKKAVEQYNEPAEGACNNPALAEPFAAACADLKQCKAELAGM